ncbi:MAG: hypothetical protein ACE37F_08635 [Nannocystaceae bacterium]|nr:hypothetical protein [bacterium]
MRLTGCLVVLGALLVACGGESDVGGAGGSSGEGAESSSSGTPVTTTGITTNGTSTGSATDPGSSSTTDAPGTESSSGVADDSSSSSDGEESTGCTPGELGCACDEEMCAEGLECIDEVCATPIECIDDDFGENITEDTAHFLGEISDDDDDGGTVMGVLTGPDDVDWFRYDGSDEAFSSVDPFRTIVSSAPVRFCKFADCPDDDVDFPCQEQAVATTSPDGRPGCCADSLIHVPDALCGSSVINDDSMIVWVRVDQAEDACVTYAFDYHF